MSRGFRSGVLAPALAGNTVAAYIVVSSAHDQELTLDRTRTLTTACEAVGPLVHSHVVAEKSRRDAAILHSSQAFLHTISQSLDLNETYQEIVMSAVNTVSGSSCLLLELNPETGDLVTVAASEPDAASLIGLRVRIRSGQSLATLLESRRSIVVDDLIAGAGVDSSPRRSSRTARPGPLSGGNLPRCRAPPSRTRAAIAGEYRRNWAPPLCLCRCCANCL